MKAPDGLGDRSTCPGEGTLLGYLDEALEPGRRREVAEHLTGCGDCRARLHALKARERAVVAWIESADPDPPPREAYALPASTRTFRRPGRWAAAAVLILGLGVLAGPARGWIVDGFRGLLGTDEVPSSVEPASPGSDVPRFGTGFVPEGTELTLQFTSPETRGDLVIEVTADSLAILDTPHSAVDLVVRPRSVRVENDAAPVGDYRVVLPATLERLRIRTSGGGESVMELAGLDGSRTVELGRPR